MSEESCFKPGEPKPRVLSEQCSTCIGRPGNPMHLTPGRLRRLVTEATREGSQGIICHQTLSYGDHPDYGGALCRWYYDTYGHLNNFIRCILRIGGFTEVPPPQAEEVSESPGE